MKRKLLIRCVLFIAVICAMTLAHTTRVNAATHTPDDAIEWVRAKNGQTLDYDGIYPGQCVDLIAFYYQYLGTRTPGGNGKDYSWNALPAGWTRIKGGVPQKGDIAVYTNGDYGHVCIVESEYSLWHGNYASHHRVENTTTIRYNSLPGYWGIIRPVWGEYTASTGNSSSYIVNVRAENISTSDATIYGDLQATQYCTSTGFYIGTDANNMQKITETANCQVKNTWYNLNKWYGALVPGTTYYYKIFAVVNGQELQSDLSSFTTQTPAAVIDNSWVDSITDTSATIHGHFAYTQYPTACGIYIGTSTSNMQKIIENANGAAVLDFWYGTQKWYGTLTPGTTYYYQMWALIGGYEHKSAIYSFKTTGDGEKPVISDVVVTDVTGHSYTVQCTVTDNDGVNRVQFPTWTETNGQDDLAPEWWTNACVKGDRNGRTYTFKVNATNHNNEIGAYITHIYAYDNVGNYTAYEVPAVNLIPLTKIYFEERNATMTVGETKQLKLCYEPANTSEPITPTIYSDGSSIVSCEDGYVIAKKTGSANIVAKLAGKEALCGISVKSAPAKPTPTKAPTPTQAPSSNQTQVSDFVARLYTVALGRNYDNAGLNDWTNKLTSGAQTGAEVARGFICSDEFKNRNLSDSDYVDTLYRTMFNREADASGKANWMNALANGMSREYVYRGFAEGAEFKNLCDSFGIKQGKVNLSQNRDQNPNLTAFVARNYTKALGRSAEEAGINDWTGRILSGKASPADVTAGFIFSPEFINKGLSNEDFVRVLYQTYFDREPDEGGYSNWVNQLYSGVSREYVVNTGFSCSQEFANLVASFGL